MAEHPPLVLRQPTDLTLEAFEHVVWEGRALALHPDLIGHLAATRGAMIEALAAGRAVYGVNTGMGYLAGVELGEDEQRQHQNNLLLGRAVGGPPYLQPDEARALLLARLAGFLSGHAGVTPGLCGYLADRLNDRFVPAIPRASIGCAGEIIPLSHAFQTFLGVGHVLADDGTLKGAAAALAERDAPAYRPAPKEGIALLAGAPGALALAISHRRAVSILTGQLLLAAACAIDAVRAPSGPYHPAVAMLANDPLMERILLRLRGLLHGDGESRRTERPGPEGDRGAGAGDEAHIGRTGTAPQSLPRRYGAGRPSGAGESAAAGRPATGSGSPSGTQAPVSFRVVPQVLAHLERILGRLEEDIRRALPAVTDSPAFVLGDFLSNGNFHAIGLTADLDGLCAALVQAGELACQHLHRLLDRRFTGLPDQLTPLPGLHSGLISVHKRAVGAVNELRRLAVPAGV
ncbi:MAG: aromatic amino acid lyase, partial [Chloroflexi bacterium]|nr:aromatic amino acid lyase [Chloroflexota bacterium]